MSDARPTQQLAADVRAALPERNATMLAGTAAAAARLQGRNVIAHLALDALVARVTDLETQVERADENNGRCAEALATTRQALTAPIGFIEALAHGQYLASDATRDAARHYAPIARNALKDTA